MSEVPGNHQGAVGLLSAHPWQRDSLCLPPCFVPKTKKAGAAKCISSQVLANSFKCH